MGGLVNMKWKGKEVKFIKDYGNYILVEHQKRI